MKKLIITILKISFILLIISLLFTVFDTDKDKSEEKISTEKQDIAPIEKKKEVKKTEYDLLKENSTLIGAWKMEFTAELDLGYDVIIEFYSRDNEYFEVMIENNAFIQKLVKDGDKYLCEREGEYYMITKNGELKAYDEEGYISEDNGFKYVKQ